VPVRAFIVQESIHGDGPSLYRTEAEAVAVITEMIEQGVAEPGEFNIRETDGGRTVRVFTPPSPAVPASPEAA
jgi:hypothetical protein